MILTFIKETLFALLLIVSIIVPPIYLGYQITPEFRKKRYIVYLLMMQAIAGKTFFEIMYLEVLIFFYLIFYLNRKKKGESLFLSLYLFSFYQSIRYLLVLFYIRMLDIDMLSEVGNGIVNSSFSLLAIVLTVVMMKRWSLDLDLFFSDAFKTHYHKSFFIILPLTVFRIFSSFMTNRNSSFYVRFDTTISLLIFILFFSWLFYIKHLEQIYRDEQTIQRQEEENRSLQGMVDKLGYLYDEVRGFRHDYGGMLASFQSAIHTGDIKEVERIYQEVLVNANLQLRSDKYTYFDLNNVGDSALRSVMTQTLFKARDYNIELTFEVKDFVKPLPIKLLDLVRMTSVLLNNAIEGAAESYQKTMNVSLVDLDTETILVIQNSRKKRPLDLEEIYQTDFSTKGVGRGLGLSNIKEIINNYEGIILDTKIEDEYFIQAMRVRKEGL